jgi:hypothetical protein
MAEGSRQSAIRALINVWLKLPIKCCATCGRDYYDGTPVDCCNNPVICTNRAAYTQFLRELRDIKLSRSNQFASNKGKTMRLGLSMPANLYLFLDGTMKRLYNERLINKEFDMFWLLRNFPQFQVPEKL